MSHGIRIEDIAWQAFQAGAAASSPNQDFNRASFLLWWHQRTEQGCDLPACAKCGFDPGVVVGASWEFLVDRDPPSLNARLFNAGARPWAYRRERDAWCWEFRAVRLLQRIPAAKARRRLTLTRVIAGNQKVRDRDNLIGGMKALVDALVLEDLLVSDGPAMAEIHYAEERGKPTGLRVLLEDLA